MALSLAASIPSTARAWQFNRHGAPRSVLTLNEHAPVPPCITNHVLIRIHHTTLSGGSAAMISIPLPFIRQPPCVPGNEFAGTIVAVGPTYTGRHGPGTQVFGSLTRLAMAKGRGTLNDYMLVREDEVLFHPVPSNVPLDVAAGFPGSGTTAMSMCLRAGIKGGERVLVHGASGGVGSLLVQLLRNFGVKEVIAVCSTRNIDLVKGLGAHEVLDYTTAPIESQLIDRFAKQPLDVIMDTVGLQGLYVNSPKYLKENGAFVNVGAMVNGPLWGIAYGMFNSLWPLWLGGIPRRYIMFSNTLAIEQLSMIAHWAEEGKLKAHVENMFDLEDVLEAFDLNLTKRVRGKMIINVVKKD